MYIHFSASNKTLIFFLIDTNEVSWTSNAQILIFSNSDFPSQENFSFSHLPSWAFFSFICLHKYSTVRNVGNSKLNFSCPGENKYEDVKIRLDKVSHFGHFDGLDAHRRPHRANNPHELVHGALFAERVDDGPVFEVNRALERTWISSRSEQWTISGKKIRGINYIHGLSYMKESDRWKYNVSFNGGLNW